MSPSDDDELRALRAEVERLKARQDELERRLSVWEARPRPPAGPAVPQKEVAARSARPQPVFETRFGLTLLNRIGVVTLILGAAFFFKYAVENEWIGPGARVASGLVAAMAALWFGELQKARNQRLFGNGITGLGIALLFVSFYAGYAYQIFGPAPAFVLMLVAASVAVVLALRYESVVVAVFGLLGGYLTPLLIKPSDVTLDVYVTVLSAAALWLSRRKRWRSLEVFALAFTVVLYATTIFHARFDRALASIFLLVFAVLFIAARTVPVRDAAHGLAMLALVRLWGEAPTVYLLSTLALAAADLCISIRLASGSLPAVSLAAYWIAFVLWSPRPSGPAFAAATLVFLMYLAWTALRQANPFVIGLNGIAYYAGAYVLLAPEHRNWIGLFGLALAGAHFLLARALQRAGAATTVLALGIAAGLFTVAIPIQFSGFEITVAWAAEAAALAWTGALLKDHRAIVASWIVLFLAFLRLALADAWMYPEPRAYAAVINARFLSFTAVALSCWAVSKWTVARSAVLVVYIGGHVVLLWGCALEVLGWAARVAIPANRASLAAASMSILMAVYALALIAAGVAAASTINRALGLILIGAVIVKLYAYDVWLLRTLYRTTAFIALGALLVASSYIYSRYRDRIEEWWRDGAKTDN
jgi:uncharacterized membrane protein